MQSPFNKDLPVFQTIDAYPFLQDVKNQWQNVRDEFQTKRRLATQFGMSELHNNLWDVCLLVDREEICPAWEQFPITSQLVKNIPGLYLVAFSVQKAGCKIYPHRGYTTNVWRSHLGLDCPPGAWLNVSGTRYEWKDGEMIVFDDMRKHHAANDSNQDRLILIIDFKK